MGLVAIAFVSCKKQVDSELTGSWKKEVFLNSVDSDSSIWHFNGGNLVIQNLSNPTLSDTGKYVVVEKSLKNYVSISGLENMTGQVRQNGEWRVIQYKKDMLTLSKPDVNPTTGEDAGLVTYEFTRQ